MYERLQLKKLAHTKKEYSIIHFIHLLCWDSIAIILIIKFMNFQFSLAFLFLELKERADDVVLLFN